MEKAAVGFAIQLEPSPGGGRLPGFEHVEFRLPQGLSFAFPASELPVEVDHQVCCRMVIDFPESRNDTLRSRLNKRILDIRNPLFPDAEADRVAPLIIHQQVSSVRQSGGITAHTVHIHHYGDEVGNQAASVKASEAITAKVGNGRFRAKDEAIGLYWNTIPGAKDPGLEIILKEGPVLWVRMRSSRSAGSEVKKIQPWRFSAHSVAVHSPLPSPFFGSKRRLSATRPSEERTCRRPCRQ